MTSAQDNLFHAIFYSIGDAVVATDKKGRVRQLNPVAEKLTGWTEAGARGKPLLDVLKIINEKTRKPVENPVDRVLREGMIIGLVNNAVLISKDGTEFPIADSGAPIKNDAGEITGAVFVFRDKTEEIKMQRAIEENEKKYRALVEQSVEMLYVHDLEGNIIEVNPAAEKWTGYSREELTAMNIFDLHSDDTGRDEIARQWSRWRPGVDNITIETKHMRKDGRLLPVEISAGKIVIGNDEVILALVRDVSERREARKALQYQFRFEKMVADISSTFVGTPIEKIDDAIEYALKESGNFFKADRSFLFRFSDDSRRMTNTHEWCAPGVSSQRERNQDFAVDKERWWVQQILQGKHVHIPDVEALPAKMDKDKREFLAEDIRSCLTIPLIRDERAFGYFGFDGVNEKKSWTDEQIVLLKVVGGIISTAITKHEIEEALKESEERYREILSTIEEGYYEADLGGNIIHCNEAACRLFGACSVDEVIGMNYKKIYKDPKSAYKAFNRVLKTGNPERGLILEMVRKDGSIRYGEISISLIKDKEGLVTGFKGIGRDITDRIEYEKNLEYLSLHDQLTGIYNRAYFEAELERFDNSREYPITIISADLDGLKLVNDTMGHETGDKLLQNCAAVLKRSLRKSDILARVGGDEFSAILPNTDKVKGEKIIRRIRKNTNAYNKGNEDLPMGISVGVATAEDSKTSLKELFKRADDMMYRDKLYRGNSSRSKIVQSLLAALAKRDYLTEGHARRLEEYCLAVGERINLSSHQLADLALLAQVHDLGKVGIPDRILFKQAPLTDEEWEVMRGHPEKGFRIASSSPDLIGVAELILKHHERWDGRGYPLGLKAEDIPVECRILAIADAYDIMTNKRPYAKMKTARKAKGELRKHAGSQFDPKLVMVFLNYLEENCEETG